MQNITGKIQDYFYINDYSNLLIIVSAIIFGSLNLFFPVHLLIIALLSFCITVFLLIKPQYCIYLIIIFSTIIFPFTHIPGISEENLPLIFHIEYLILTCLLSVLIRQAFWDERVNLRTKIDGWNLFFICMYFLATVTSVHNGYHSFIKLILLIVFFYLVIYFLRSRKVTYSNLIKLILIVALFQASLGILQSLTGSFGANFKSDRNILGYLGLGSTLVWQGRGLLNHFNTLGALLGSLTLFFIPVYYYLVKNKTKGNMIFSVILAGLLMTYSRGSFLGVLIGFIVFLYQKQKDKFKFFAYLIGLVIVLSGIVFYIQNTSYLSTLNPRDEIWSIILNEVTSSKRVLLFGTGMTSYEEVIFPNLPGNVYFKDLQNYQAHSFYIFHIVEIGIIGLIFIISFFINNLLNAVRGLNHKNKLLRSLNLSVMLFILFIFIEGIFDYVFNEFYSQIWIYLMLGILYAHYKELPAKSP